MNWTALFEPSPAIEPLGYPELTINSPLALDPDYPDVNGIAPLDPELDDPESIAAALHFPEANIAAYGDQSIYN